MIAYMLYNRGTAAVTRVEDLARRLGEAGVRTELVDADSGRGIELAEHYDVLGRPALVLVREDGSPIEVWQGEEGMPAANDVAYLAHQ